MTPILGTIDSTGVVIDTPYLLESNLLVQANSGGGKSYALRRLLEQTAPLVQQIVIDPEGEFASLREKFDYVVCAPRGADAVINPDTATMLARRLLETGVSAILDIFDMDPHERELVVKRFCVAMVDAPKSLWHPTLVVIDEAHVFCPESAHSECVRAVVSLASRGRKRGFGTVLATQRLAKLNNNAAAECNNKMLGRTSLPSDIDKCAKELGIRAKDAMQQLRRLHPGEFYVFGPALGVQEPSLLKVGEVVTTHPKAGQRRLVAPPAPSAKVKKKLAELGDIQTDAVEEARTIEELTEQVRRLTAAASATRDDNAGREEVAKLKTEIDALKVEMALRRTATRQKAVELARYVDGWASDPLLDDTAAQAFGDLDVAYIDRVKAYDAPRTKVVDEPARTVRPIPQPTNGAVTRPEQKVLDALATIHGVFRISPVRKETLAAHAGYAPTSGSFNNNLSKLRTAGYIDYPVPGFVVLLDGGKKFAKAESLGANVDPRRELPKRWLSIVDRPLAEILTVVFARFPGSLSKEQLAHECGRQLTSGSFNNYLSKLRTLGAIDYPKPGFVRATDAVFPGG